MIANKVRNGGINGVFPGSLMRRYHISNQNLSLRKSLLQAFHRLVRANLTLRAHSCISNNEVNGRDQLRDLPEPVNPRILFERKKRVM